MSELPPGVPSAVRKVDIISAMLMEVQKHSLLESLFIYSYFDTYYGYLILDKRTKQLMAVDCGDYKACRLNVERVMKLEGASFTHLFLTHEHEKHCAGYAEWRFIHPKLKIYSSAYGSYLLPGCNYLHEGDLTQIGDLCVFPLHTPGHSPGSLSYVVTEVSPTSTKTPALFTGDTLTTGACGPANDPEAMYESIKKLKSLPSETLLFPGHECTLESLTFARMLEHDNEFLNKKLDWAKEKRANGEMTIGSLMGEERLYNPFIRCDQNHFLKLTEETEPKRCFAKLRKLMDKLVVS